MGRRLLVPFRNKPIVGVTVCPYMGAPDLKRIREIAEVLDSVPALPEKLLELGRWISRYYVAPIGETLRAMLPPDVDLRYVREYWITAEGHAYLAELAASEELTDVERDELAFLRRFENRSDGEEVSRRASTPHAGGEAAAEKIFATAISPHGKRRETQNTDPENRGVGGRGCTLPLPSEIETRVREILTATRGPLPASKLLEEAKISRAALDKLEKGAACAHGKNRSSPTKTRGTRTSLRPKTN